MSNAADTAFAEALQRFLEPVSADSVCGPDLDFEDDADYANFMFPLEELLSQRFLETGGKPADRSNIKLDEVIESISGLLERSRDLRLVAALAQCHAVLLKPEGVLVCVQLMQRMLETFWEEVHPAATDGDFGYRRSMVEALDDRSRVAIPIGYFPLVNDKKIGPVSYRVWEIAQKPELKLPAETPMQALQVSEAFNSEAGRGQVQASYDVFKGLQSALKGIRSVFLENIDFDNVPSFGITLGAIDDVIAMLEREAPWLLPETEPGAEDMLAGDAEAIGGDAPASLAAAPPAAAVLPLTDISSHSQAAALLTQIERYFCNFEPSSPALILVHQARKLLGRPLVEALEALAPSRVDAARLIVDTGSGFTLSIDRMRQLTASALFQPEESGPGDEPEAVAVTSREAASSAMQSIERFLAVLEPTSPVPLLLSRARSLMNKDFSGLLSDYFNQTEGQ
ncbi:ImpA family type VI secretion system protein [Hoeflea ulvae]|uniref:Type VI secretion system ImpA family N-terminal domain-containing protein n=1 Tax=Hoeflea ulvae TaxID=2983764 RepID=A0ABT3YHU0_9HYPH|nr:type VI secretion system ImpA family N-terminal domain-containing protein [Hoeflea ulvae]MCY0095192.1 type VI secretion system ImpA family N-terminal domain-containing protein [Hoeflea ulvae]